MEHCLLLPPPIGVLWWGFTLIKQHQAPCFSSSWSEVGISTTRTHWIRRQRLKVVGLAQSRTAGVGPGPGGAQSRGAKDRGSASRLWSQGSNCVSSSVPTSQGYCEVHTASLNMWFSVMSPQPGAGLSAQWEPEPALWSTRWDQQNTFTHLRTRVYQLQWPCVQTRASWEHGPQSAWVGERKLF